MNCREFEKRWNLVLDLRSDGLPELDPALATHAASCERCQATSARYQLLRQAVSNWGPPPLPSAADSERLRSLSVPSTPVLTLRHRVRYAIPLTAAAAILALAWFVGPWREAPPAPPGLEPPTTARVASPRPIEIALGEATSATIDLAREASASAARIGRDVLGLEATDAPTDPGMLGAEVVSEPTPSASEMLQTVGERVNAGVKPISGSARHAFSFLLGPPPGSDRRSTEPADLSR